MLPKAFLQAFVPCLEARAVLSGPRPQAVNCRSSFFVFAGGGAGDSPVGALSWCDEMQIARRVCFLVLNKAEGS